MRRLPPTSTPTDTLLPYPAPFRSGLVFYPEALADMEESAAARRNEHARERIWLLEHPPLYTAGTSANDAELLEKLFPVYEAGRGGRYTYHGPGQRTGYKIGRAHV